MAGLSWLAGDVDTHRSVEAWLAGRLEADAVASTASRSLHRLESNAGPDLLVKRFALDSGPHRWRDALKRRVARDACSREWAALRALHAAGVPVPTPRGRALDTDGHALLISDYVRGPALWDWLREPVQAAERRARLGLVAEAVGRLHRAAFAHGDLHPGNIVLGPVGPVLLDFQRSRRAAPGGRAQIADLGLLDYGLATRGVSRGDRLRVRRVALEAAGFEPTRTRLRAVGTASRRAARRHATQRVRQATRAGGRFAHTTIDGRPALLAPGYAESEVAEVLTHHERDTAAAPELGDEVRNRKARSTRLTRPTRVYRCESTPLGRTPLRVADFLASRRAARAWRSAEGLRVRGIDCPRAVALVGPAPNSKASESTLILCAAAAADREPRATWRDPKVLDDLALLLARLHARGVLGAQLTPDNVCVEGGARRAPRAGLLQLDGIRFRKRSKGRARVHELTRFAAALAEAGVPAAERRRGLERYRRALSLPEKQARAYAKLLDAHAEARTSSAHSASAKARQAPPSTSAYSASLIASKKSTKLR